MLWGPSLQGLCPSLTLCLVGGECLFYLENIFFFLRKKVKCVGWEACCGLPCRLVGGGVWLPGSAEPIHFLLSLG